LTHFGFLYRYTETFFLVEKRQNCVIVVYVGDVLLRLYYCRNFRVLLLLMNMMMMVVIVIIIIISMKLHTC